MEGHCQGSLNLQAAVDLLTVLRGSRWSWSETQRRGRPGPWRWGRTSPWNAPPRCWSGSPPLHVSPQWSSNQRHRYLESKQTSVHLSDQATSAIDTWKANKPLFTSVIKQPASYLENNDTIFQLSDQAASQLPGEQWHHFSAQWSSSQPATWRTVTPFFSSVIKQPASYLENNYTIFQLSDQATSQLHNDTIFQLSDQAASQLPGEQWHHFSPQWSSSQHSNYLENN